MVSRCSNVVFNLIFFFTVKWLTCVKRISHQGRCVYCGVEKALITALINYHSVSKIITFLFFFFLRSQNPNNMQSIVSSYHLCLAHPPPPVLCQRLLCHRIPSIRLPSRRSTTSLGLFTCGRPHPLLICLFVPLFPLDHKIDILLGGGQYRHSQLCFHLWSVFHLSPSLCVTYSSSESGEWNGS